MIFDRNVDFGIKKGLSLGFRGHGCLVSGLSSGLRWLFFFFKKCGFDSFGSDGLLVGVDSVFKRVFFGGVFG